MATREQRIKDANAKLVTKLNDLESRKAEFTVLTQAAYDALTQPQKDSSGLVIIIG